MILSLFVSFGVEGEDVAARQAGEGVLARLPPVEPVGGAVTDQRVVAVAADRVLDHDAIGDGEAAGDLVWLREEAARVRIVVGQGRGAQIDRHALPL